MAAGVKRGGTDPLVTTDGSGGHRPEVILYGSGGGAGGEIQGDVAHDAADSGNPVGIGGVADDSPRTDVTIGDRVKAWFRRNGALAIYNAYGANPTDDINSSLERQNSVTPTLTISASPDYAADDVISGIVTFPTVNYASGKGVKLDKLVLCEDSGQAPALRIIFFKATPSGGTYTDNSALAWGAGDLANIVGAVSIATGDWVVTSSKSEVTARDLNIPVAVSATSLFALVIAKGAYNAAATDDLLLTGTFVQRF